MMSDSASRQRLAGHDSRRHFGPTGEITRRFQRLLVAARDKAIEKMRHGGKVTLNSDDLFMLCPEYEENPAIRPVLGPQLYEVASRFIDRTYTRLLSRRVRGDVTVVFTAGGSATGKSTILRAAGKRSGVDFVVDTTFSNTKRALAQVERALDAGRKVEIYYVYRDFAECVLGMVRRAQDAASGRLVPIDDMARTHYGAPRALLEAMTRYGDDPRVLIYLFKNEGARRLSRMTLSEFDSKIPRSIDGLQQLGQSVLDELRKNSRGKRESRKRDHQNHNSGRDGLRIPLALYKAARSKAQTAGAASRKSDARSRKPRAEKST